ncbi:hypothetical protein [Nocardia sp. alder85J]|uniref:hypothetical protein n=1 Tax=Nocardia sp. alder85J TaxID=2862949 RepID=UPI001CD35DE5|nr:hypothetical protein [Nocardia sp. alder85J]MCX4096982.1 hypothetical protein [Nocardia sp. alder85J]
MRKSSTVGGSAAVRKSTAILGGVWVATLIVYLFVKPATPEHTGFPIANTFQKSTMTSTPAR